MGHLSERVFVAGYGAGGIIYVFFCKKDLHPAPAVAIIPLARDGGQNRFLRFVRLLEGVQMNKKLLAAAIAAAAALPMAAQAGVTIYGKVHVSLDWTESEFNAVAIDPDTGAHGPNESMHIGVYTKTVKANVHLYAELARALAK